jgi:molybdopterin molybdotransferase
VALVPLDEARRLVLPRCPPLHPTAVPLLEALGLVAAAAVRAEELVPPFDNTAVDGYAVQAADTVAPGWLRVVGNVAAGAAPDVAVGPGEAVRIMTGAPMPEGADAVVMVESTTTSDDGTRVEVRETVARGAAVRRAGDDLRPGDVVVEPGMVLAPGRLGVLASLGVRRVPVRRRPLVGVLSTGDELVDGPGPLRPGQIRDSNRPTLLALARTAGCGTVDLGVAGDDEAAITEALERGVSDCDAVLTSGGVSMGDYDLVKAVLDRIGDMAWLQVAIKPAKPLAFGVVKGVPVFGLPGNPVSSMVSFELFARPALRQMMGFPEAELDRPRVLAVAEVDLRRDRDGKTHFQRVVDRVGEDGRHRVRSAGGQGSHQLAAMAAANALAVLPDGDGVLAGGEVTAMLLS